MEAASQGFDASDEAFALVVECYAGYRGEETPRRFRLGGRVVEVAAVADRWLAPDHRYFKVVDAEDRRYILRHDVPTNHWSLTFYDGSS